jgi:hypothetical protein
MQSAPQMSSAEYEAGMEAPVARRADLAYQTVTVAAIVLLLVSLWVF